MESTKQISSENPKIVYFEDLIKLGEQKSYNMVRFKFIISLMFAHIFEQVHVDPNQLATVCYTSGSTGSPKVFICFLSIKPSTGGC